MYIFVINQVFIIYDGRINENSTSIFNGIIAVQGITNDDASVISYDVIKHPDGNFTIVLIDQITSNKKLGVISTTNNFLWETSWSAVSNHRAITRGQN